MVLIGIDRIAPICIARLADADVESVAFDITAWREKYPKLTRYRVEVTSPGGVVYLPVVELSYDKLIWPIVANDTAVAGNGMYQIVAEGDGGERKTSAYSTFAVNETMPGTAGDVPPDPAKPWVDKVAGAAQDAMNAAAHPPIIGESGNWLLWDAAAKAYIDSGVNARGEPGKDAAPYTLPTASASVKGGVMVGDGLEMDGDVMRVKPKGVYELIETITLEEDTAIERTAEPDGTPYRFVAMTIKSMTTGVMEKSCRMYYCSNGIALASCYFGAITAEGTRYKIDVIEPAYGYWRAEWSDWRTNNSAYSALERGGATMEMMYRMGEYPVIDRIRTNGNLPAGTTLEIWGVRANA